MYAIKADSRNVRATASLNDVPLASLTGTNVGNVIEFAGRWLEDGENRLRITVHGPSLLHGGNPGFVGSDGQPLGSALDGAEAWVQIHRLPPDFAGGEVNGEIVAEVRWRIADVQSEPAFPTGAENRFLAAALRGMRWRNSRLPADPALARPQLIAWLRGLAASLEQGDSNALVNAAEPGIRDTCAAIGQNADQQLEGFRAMLQDEARGLRLLPFRDEEVRIEPIAYGRLLLCSRSDGTPLLRAGPGSATDFEIEIRAGMVNNGWVMF